MKVTVTSRNYNIETPFRTYIEERLDKLDRFFDKLLEAQVILHVEKYRHSAEVKILAYGTTLNGKDIAEDMRTAVDNAVEKLEKQVKKYKEKLKDRKYREDAEFSSYIDGEAHGEEDNRINVSDEIHVEKQIVNSMWMTDAITLFREEKRAYFLFKNIDSERVNLLFWKGDGSIGALDAHISE